MAGRLVGNLDPRMVVRTVELMDALMADRLDGKSVLTLAVSKPESKVAEMAAMLGSNSVV